MKIRTSLSQQLIKHQLFKGFSIALIGALGLLLGGIFLPVPLMKTWGMMLFFISLGLITIGLLPYRRFSRLQNKPNELIVTEKNNLEFWSKGVCRLIIPLDRITRMDYIDETVNYGIAVWVQGGANISSNLASCQVITNDKSGADFFFLFFSKRAFGDLSEMLQEELSL